MPVIKKYENRRLYDTAASRYVNLEDIAKMIAEDQEVVVTDVKSGRDLTSDVLLQIVSEDEGDRAALPAPLLRRIIRTRGADPLHRLVREQLALGLELLDAQLGHSEVYLEHMYRMADHPGARAEPDAPAPAPWDFGAPTLPFGAPPIVAERTVNAYDASARLPSPERTPDPAWRADPNGGEELLALREELARLEARLKRA